MSIKPRNRKEIFLNALADGKAPDVKPRTREEKFLMEQAQRESKGTSWNDLPDRPFYEETITTSEPFVWEWDGNRDNVEVLEFDYGSLIKISDLVFTPEVQTGFVAKGVYSEYGFIETDVFSLNIKDLRGDGSVYYLSGGANIYVPDLGEEVRVSAELYSIPNDNTTLEAFSFAEKGLYVYLNADPQKYVSYFATTSPITSIKTTIKTIDYKFMPEGYPKVETETVEVVPEQSVETNNVPPSPVYSNENIEENKTYKVIVNGVSYPCIAYFDGGKERIALGDDTFIEVPFFIECFDNSLYITTAEQSTITIAIYEEQEVVKKLDPKFIGDSMTVFQLGNGAGDRDHLYHLVVADDLSGYSMIGEMVTKADLIAAVKRGVIYINNIFGALELHAIEQVVFDEDYGQIEWNGVSYYTAEYEDSGEA